MNTAWPWNSVKALNFLFKPELDTHCRCRLKHWLTGIKYTINIHSNMIRFGKITVIYLVILFVLGCNWQPPVKPVYEQVKIYDIAPTPSDMPGTHLQGLIELDTYFFELPADNISLIRDLWDSKLSSSPLKYNNPEAFRSSGFIASTGTMEMWQDISKVMRSAKSKKAKTVSLLLFETRSDYVSVADIEKERTVFYTGAGGKVVGLSLSKGVLALQMNAQKIPETRGASRLTVQPVFRRPGPEKLKKLIDKKNNQDTIFDSTGFEIQMSPGQFVMLGPGQYGLGQMNLSGLFFSNPKNPSLARIYLILCRNITE
jgi:hypothetical protein